MKIKNHGLEFKLKEVQLSSQPGVLVTDVADSLGIHPFMLSKWRKQVRDGEAKPRSIRHDMPVTQTSWRRAFARLSSARHLHVRPQG